MKCYELSELYYRRAVSYFRSDNLDAAIDDASKSIPIATMLEASNSAATKTNIVLTSIAILLS